MKHPVDTSQWGEFVVGELFDCDTTKTFYPNKSELPPGNTPYITRSTYDNGISGYYDDINNEFTIEGNCLTIGAEGGIAFWQPKPFIAGVKVYTIRHPQLNELTALFVASLLNAHSANYSYTNARVLAKIKAESIKLPLKPSANPSNYTQDDIDWTYIETVMSRVTEKAKDRLANLPQPTDKKKTPVNTSAWGEFVVGELFECEQTKAMNPKSDGLVKGDTPFITSTVVNNGIAEQYQDPDNLFTRPGKCITISAIGRLAFYQTTQFIPAYKVYALRHPSMNRYNGLFICSLLNSYEAHYNYANIRSMKKLKAESIKLPLKASANRSDYTQDDIDWGYMDSFMQAIEEKAHERTASLKKQI